MLEFYVLRSKAHVLNRKKNVLLIFSYIVIPLSLLSSRRDSAQKNNKHTIYSNELRKQSHRKKRSKKKSVLCRYQIHWHLVCFDFSTSYRFLFALFLSLFRFIFSCVWAPKKRWRMAFCGRTNKFEHTIDKSGCLIG